MTCTKCPQRRVCVVLGALILSTCLLPLHAAAAASNDAGRQLASRQLEDDQECSSVAPWVEEYVELHKQQRGQADAKYMVFACANNNAGKCPGLGDRFRGMLFAAKLAIHFKRVLLLMWEFPAPLESFVVPAAINWHITPELDINIAHNVTHISGYASELTADGEFPEKFLHPRTLLISTNHFDEGNELPGPNFTLVSKEASCLFNALFAPSPETVAATQRVRAQLLGPDVADGDYVAVHLRMGHLDGEMYDVNRGWDKFQGVLSVLRCAQKYALQRTEQRRRVLAGGLPSGAAPTASSAAGSAQSSVRQPPLGQASQGLGPPAYTPCLPDLDRAAAARRLLRSNAASKEQQPHNADDKEKEDKEDKEAEAQPGSEGDPGTDTAPQGDGAEVNPAASDPAPTSWDFSPPVLLLTDDVFLRQLVAEGVFRGFVGPAYTAHHLQRAKGPNVTLEDHMATFVDLLLLARARCMVHSRSGFSKTAQVWSWPSCEVDIRDCIKHHYLRVAGGR